MINIIFLILNLVILIVVFQLLRLTVKTQTIIWLICLPITFVIFFILNVTAEPSEMRDSSDNLTLALFFYLFHPIILSFYYLTGTITNHLIKNYLAKHRIYILIGSIFGFVLFFIFQYTIIQGREYTGGFHFANDLYFNMYTFLILLFFSMFCGTILTVKKESN